jgi:hypothetical protein
MAATAETNGFVDQLFTIVSRLAGLNLQTRVRARQDGKKKQTFR